MKNVVGDTYSADFSVPRGAYTSFVLIFSSDFTGTVQGQAITGATRDNLSFESGGDLLGEVKVTVSAGSVTLFGA